MRRLCLAVLTLVSTAALGETPFEARFVKQWVAHCQAPFGMYELTFRSAGGDPTDDDMTVSMKVGAGHSVVIPLKQALFFSGKLAASSRSQCDSISTATLLTGNALLLVQRDDRPSENRLSAILLSGKDGAVLDTAFDLGAQVGSAELSENAGVVRVKLIHKWREATAAEPIPILGWLRISDVGGKIRSTWE
jgi:hypothetical protein